MSPPSPPKSDHFVPKVISADTVASHPKRQQTIALMRKAAQRVGLRWPQDISIHANYRIVLAPENVILVQTTATESLTNGQSLVVGIDAFHALAAKLSACTSDELMDLAVATLAHETFHLGQMHRIRVALGDLRAVDSSHGKTQAAALQNSGFAQGIDDDMSTPWIALALGLAVAHPTRAAMPQPIAELADTVSELRADIRALNVLKATERDATGFGTKLLALRIADGKDPSQYQIGTAMKAILAGGLPSERDAARVLWSQVATGIAALDPARFGLLAQAAIAANFYRPPPASPAGPTSK